MSATTSFLSTSTFLSLSFLSLALVACDGSDTKNNPGTADASPPGTADASPPGTPDASPPGTPDGAVVEGDFANLITGDWTISAGSENYWCAWKTVSEDTYITGFRALAPNGTHHTVLSVDPDYAGEDKEQACSAGTIADQMLYATGVGTPDYTLPEGVAIKVNQGETLMLNLHLFNATDAAISATAGMAVTTTTLAEVENLAEYVFAGTGIFAIQGNGTDQSANGKCTMKTDGNIFALWPHMHTAGKHMKIVHKGNVMLDTDFAFDDQKMYPVTPFAVSAGDTIDVTCTWNWTASKDSPGPKRFGGSSNDEMCFAGLYRFPASEEATGFCYL